MWRFILLSFVFLGWAFYELSGGADYHPSPNSIQGRATLEMQPSVQAAVVERRSPDGGRMPDTVTLRTDPDPASHDGTIITVASD